MNSFLYKGVLIFVQGRLQLRTSTERSTIERQTLDVVASTVHLLEKARTTTAAPSSDTGVDLEDSPY
jgi:single-stranded DNA-binding protein